MITYEDYFNSEIEYNNGFLLDKYGSVIMWEGEEPIMKLAAQIITNNGGDILNIGFGLGIIDYHIQLNKPNSHTIIEPHKQIYEEAIKNGWNQNVIFINKNWNDAVNQFIKEGRKFDGIYFDIFEYKGDVPSKNFLKKLKYILKENGIYSYFLNHDPGYNFQSNFNKIAGDNIYDVSLINLKVEYDDKLLEKRNGYTVKKDHYIPIIRFKKNLN